MLTPATLSKARQGGAGFALLLQSHPGHAIGVVDRGPRHAKYHLDSGFPDGEMPAILCEADRAVEVTYDGQHILLPGSDEATPTRALASSSLDEGCEVSAQCHTEGASPSAVVFNADGTISPSDSPDLVWGITGALRHDGHQGPLLTIPAKNNISSVALGGRAEDGTLTVAYGVKGSGGACHVQRVHMDAVPPAASPVGSSTLTRHDCFGVRVSDDSTHILTCVQLCPHLVTCFDPRTAAQTHTTPWNISSHSHYM